MRQVYVDSGALVALLRPSDRAHRRMLAHFQRLLERRDMLVTTDIVVAETATQLRRDPGLDRAVAFRDALAQSVRGGGIRILDSDDMLRQRAFAVMAAHPDIALSYGDCVAAALAGNKRVAAIVGLNPNLRRLGLVVEPD
ncbi:MAG TPA: type II toxin-antitoxin system VapC family toxin [Euzebyales bacterium]|nr:type II toxin-antitoxin system VapC family toxin [Euzebyales bacterium]